MNTFRLTITLEKDKTKLPFHLLALADPSKKFIEQYTTSGSSYIAKLKDKTIGVFVLLPTNNSSIEIKNIAIDPVFQGQGFGKKLLQFASQLSLQKGYKTLIIGTGNSSIYQLALYQKVGFEIISIKQNFFLEHYEHPIIENGIPCKHLIVLEKKLF